jgi:hypothetical protein
VKSNRIRLLVAALSLGLLGAAWQRTNTLSTMTQTAQALLASLSEEQKQRATFRFEDDERFFWHFVPGNNIEQSYKRKRLGLTLGEMSPHQKHLANALLSAGLSQSGYIKAVSVMSLEDVLRILEKDTAGRRDPEKYHFSVFGTPSDKGNWSYRVEGHHLSLHFTVVNGKIGAAPMFYGANPAEVRQGPRAGLRVLAREEDLGRELIASLTAEQKKTAIVSAQAYKDILTEASRKAALTGQPNGLSAAKMTAKQRELLQNLVGEYIGNLPDAIAETRAAKLKAAGNNLYFAWAGVEERGGPHYYRVAAPAFLIEYDNTQNNANHIHSVWREFDGDFGDDLLKAHYESSHRR